MGSARDSAPDPNHTSSTARSSAPTRLRSCPPSVPASVSSRQSSRDILPAVDLVTPHATAFGNVRPPAQQPKLFDSLHDAPRAFEYSLRTEQSAYDAARGSKGSAARAPSSLVPDPSAGPDREIWQRLPG